MLDILKHPVLQRLSRIKQLGLTSLVYPGAQHTRFQHSIGAYHLMTEAILSLRQKGLFIFQSEEEAVCAAILLHDIGHGPFSHVLENTLFDGISHEDISLLLMERINKELNGQLTLAIKIFKNEYNKRYLHQLISSQLDMDRLDYLSRDSFFCGVKEGSIGSARIIKMLNVADDNLVIDSKGVFSIENYLTSRRLMYWQVYLHKTTIACELMLVNALKRARKLIFEGKQLFASSSLIFFLSTNVNLDIVKTTPEALSNFLLLDDTDIWCALKEWSHNEDKVLSLLSAGLIKREIFKVEESTSPFSEEHIEELTTRLAYEYRVSFEEAKYLCGTSMATNEIYNPSHDNIGILLPDNTVCDISEASDVINVNLLSKTVKKYYFCHF